MSDDDASWDRVVADMRERDRTGREEYGRPLRPFDGRSGLRDAYEESLDLAVYLRKTLDEIETIRDELKTQIACIESVGTTDERPLRVGMCVGLTYALGLIEQLLPTKGEDQ